MSQCIDCDKFVKEGFSRCFTCQREYVNNAPKIKCSDCGSMVIDTGKGYKRCYSCQQIAIASLPKRQCLGCGKVIIDKGFLQCYTCNQQRIALNGFVNAYAEK